MAAALPLVPAHATEHAELTYGNLVKTLIRFGAIDVNDDDVIDSVALVQECALYNHYFKNDFRWAEFQNAVRKSIRQEIETYPTAIAYKAILKLDRYDFDEKIFRFTSTSSPNNANTLTFNGKIDAACENEGNKRNILPTMFRFVLDQPINLPGIPLGVDDGKALLERLKEDGNKSRIIFAQFNMRITNIEKMSRPINNIGFSANRLTQGKGDIARIDARLISLDLYEDQDYKRLVYQYAPQ